MRTTRARIAAVTFTTLLLVACGGDPGSITTPGAGPTPGDPPPAEPPPAEPPPASGQPPVAVECAGTLVPSDHEVRATYLCAPAYAGLSVDLARLQMQFTVLGGANAGDVRPPSFTFADVPAAGAVYAFADLARFEAYFWWIGTQGDDLYMYVASKAALTPEPEWGQGSVSVTSVAPIEGGGWEIHGAVEVTLAPHPASISLLGNVRWDDPAAKLPLDATGTVQLSGTF